MEIDGPLSLRPLATIMPAAPRKPAFLQLERQEAVAFERAGHDEVSSLLGEEAEALVVGRIADEQDRAVAALLGFHDRRTHQRRADALAFMRGIDGQRAEQQRIDRRAVAADAGFDVPQAHGADDMAVADRGRPAPGPRPEYGRGGSFSDDLLRRSGPMARSSRFSRATTSPGFSGSMVKALHGAKNARTESRTAAILASRTQYRYQRR